MFPNHRLSVLLGTESVLIQSGPGMKGSPDAGVLSCSEVAERLGSQPGSKRYIILKLDQVNSPILLCMFTQDKSHKFSQTYS